MLLYVIQKQAVITFAADFILEEEILLGTKFFARPLCTD